MRFNSLLMIASATTLCCAAAARSDLLFADEFSGTTLAPEWTVAFAGNTDGWNSAVNGGLLTVGEIFPLTYPPGCDTSGGPWSDVNIDRTIAPAGNFTCDALISWDSQGLNSAMQALWISLLDCDGNVLGQVGFVDAWAGTTGAKASTLGGVFAQSGAGSLPLAGTTTLQISRSGATWETRVGGTLIQSRAVTGVPRTLRLTFAYYAAHLCSGGNTLFGTEAIDLITLQGDASPLEPADISGDGQVDGADLGILLGEWSTSDCAADLNNDRIVDGADLGILLGAWSS